MNNFFHRNFVYNIVSYFIVFPIFRFIFRGYIIGKKNIPKNTSFIIVSNHGSLLDPPFIGHALGLKVGFMAKYELFNIPVLAQIIRACGAYPVKRGLTNKNSILTATDKLFNNEVVGIFIDGTRQKNGLVNKPKKGAALIAFKTQKLLLPVAIVNSHKLIQFKSIFPILNKVIIKVGKPISPPLSSSKDDINFTTNICKDQINYLLG